MLRRFTAVTWLCLAPAPLTAQAIFRAEPLASDTTLPRDGLPQARADFVAWLQDTSTVKPDSLQVPVREHLFALIANDAKRRYRTHGRAFPTSPDTGLAELFTLAERSGALGTRGVAAAIRGDRSTPEQLGSAPFEVAFSAPLYTLTATAEAWRVRFPYYFMITGAQRTQLANGTEASIATLSTLFAPNDPGIGGASQATILLVSARTDSVAAFAAFWLRALGASSSGTAPSPIAGAVGRYTGYDAAHRMRKEVVVFAPLGRAIIAAYIGLDGTFEANRPHFEDLLGTLQVHQLE